MRVIKWSLLLIIPLLLILSNTLGLFYDSEFLSESNLKFGEIEEVIGFFEGGSLEIYSGDELSHMEDVRVLINFGQGLLLVLILLLALVFALEKGNSWLFAAGAILALVVLGLFALFDFSSFFNSFHKLFFPQGNWQFSPGSKLIKDFPLSFFMLAGKKIFIDTLWQSGVVVALGLGSLLLGKKK